MVKARGEFVRHKHDDTDDFFLVLAGRLAIQLRGRDDVELGLGELFVVPCEASSTARARTRRPTCCSSSRSAPQHR